MFMSLLDGNSVRSAIIAMLIRIPAVLLAISIHEAAHGWMADKLGDPTAKMMGRVTLNPFAHFDLLGALCMLFANFGWAKPVMFDTRCLKKPKRDVALIAIAGPLSNFITAFVFYIVYVVSALLLPNAFMSEVFLSIIAAIVTLNVSLMVFNFIPVPPLDGSKILITFLPKGAYNWWLKYERYGFIILFVLLMLGVLDLPINFLCSAVLRFMGQSVSLVINLFI